MVPSMNINGETIQYTFHAGEAVWTCSADTTTATTVTTTWNDASGTNYRIVKQPKRKKGDKRGANDPSKRLKFGPKVYFNYVKTNFKIAEKESLKKRLDKLRRVVEDTKQFGQKALFENLSKAIALAVREAQAVAIGKSKFILEAHIKQFLWRADDIYYKKLDEFPRVLPKNIMLEMRKVKKKRVFDEYYILYTDYTNESLKTNKQKIKEKDPIIFGKFAYDTKLFYICDWEDEHCDLTFDKFVDAMVEDNENYNVSDIPPVSEGYMKKLVKSVKTKFNRLNKTNPDNYKRLMKKER